MARHRRDLLGVAAAAAILAACSDGAERPPLTGHVVRHGGEPVAGAKIEVHGRRATSGADGAFVLHGVPAGAQLARVLAGGERPHAAPIFVPQEGAEGITIAIADPPGQGEADLWFAGDVMFARRYQDPNADGNTDDALVLAGHDWDRRILGHVTPLIQDADTAVVNFESAATELGMIHPRKPYTLRSDPRTLDALAAAGVDVLGLGNNHVYDYTDDGVAGTLAAVDEAGLLRAGAGMRWRDAVEPLIVEVNGLRIALISATSITGRPTGDDATEDEDMPPYYTADPPDETGGVDKPGALRLDVENVEEALRRADARGADLQVLIAHGGTQYSSVESPWVGQVARAAIDRGVDLVVGHHPHVVQGVEVYRGVPIVYSVGNLVFDQQFVETFAGLVVEARATRSGFREVALRPIWLDEWAPRPMAGPDGMRLLRRVAARSAELGASIRVDAGTTRAVILPSPPTETARRQVLVTAGGRRVPISIPEIHTAPWFVTGPGQAGVDFGRSLLASSAFDDSAADDDAARPAGWQIVGREKDLAGGVLRLHRSAASATDSIVRSIGRVRVTPGQRLTLAGRWRASPGAGAAIARLAIYADRETGSEPIVVVEARDAPGDWQPFDVSVIPPAGAEWAQVQLVHDPPTSDEDGDVLFDDVDLIAWSGAGQPPPADATWLALEVDAAMIDLASIP